MPVHLPLTGFYQFGYVSLDVDAAAAALRERFGVTRTRYRSQGEAMQTLHAWTGDTMVEVIVPGPAALALFTDVLPQAPGALALHHLGRRIEDATGWAAMERAVEQLGLDRPMHGAVMDGQLHYAYVDTRTLLGIYSEYVWLEGEALEIYADVPRN